jgi:Heparinase II/III-like protein/Heparinase II/III N-terminus
VNVQVVVAETARPFALVTSRWRRVSCIIEEQYRDLSIAAGVCEGIFTFAGVTLELGTTPDWLSTALPADDEWRIDWHKFYYGLDLAYAFAVTGDAKYRHTWKQLVQSWIAQMPVGCDSSDVAARRITNWIYAWNAFSRVCEFETDFENEIVSHLAAEVSHLRRNLTAERNHRTLELYALFIAALALPELDRDDLLEFAIAELHRNLLTDVRPDGVHREQSTHYHMTALRSFLGARENEARFGLEFSSRYDERLEKACEFLLHVQRPDGLIPALSDADTGNYSDLLKLAATIFNREDFLYAATNGEQGSAPKETCPSFADGGYYIQRSGWGKDARYLVFDCGPLGDGGHGHSDFLNVEVAANGRPLIVDPGRFTYAEDESNWRWRFKGTAAHNTVCVDDLDQVPYRRGKPKGPVADARLVERFTAPGFDVLSGEVRSPSYEAVHTRRIFFVAGEYWLIVDSLRGEVPHKYDLRFHLAPDALNHCTHVAGPHNTGIRTPNMVLLFAVANLGHPYNDFKPELSQGWVAPRYGIKEAAPVVSVVSNGQANVDFYTLIAPRELSAPLPQFQVLTEGHVRIDGVGINFNEADELSWQSDTDPKWRRRAS